MIRTYTELSKLKTFEDRFNYLKLEGNVGISTFGFNRYLNQLLYNDDVWKRARRKAIMRDGGDEIGTACDLGIIDRPIFTTVIVHHMNPITIEDIVNRNSMIFDPEYLITTYLRTHNAIHYSDDSILLIKPIERTKNDTIPWRK